MVSQQLIEIIIKAQDKASDTAKKVDDNLKRIGKTSNLLGKIPGFNILKTKISNVAQVLDGKLGGALTKARNHFVSFGGKIKDVGSSMKTRMGGAIDGVRAKLTKLSGGAKSASRALSFLKGAASMTAGMIGYDLVNSMIQTTRASLNARSSIRAFASRLKMSAKEVDAFQKGLDELQKTYKKIDMDVVGQQATDMAYRLGIGKESLTELTETTAIFTDAMQRNGRSAEDSMLAMSDAMDGQFVRLKEIGIGQDDLMKNGWSGDINDKTGLLHAMNAALKEQHYDELAKSVDTLDDAWQVLTITISNLLESVLVPLTPVIVGIISALTYGVDALKPIISIIQEALSYFGDWINIPAILIGVGIAANLISGWITATLVPALAAAALAALDFAAAMLANPLTWVVIALAAVAIAIYKVGQAFGWWTDVSSMLQAIWAGVQRLWNAFINHPDVKATIEWLNNGLQILGSWINQAAQAVMDFFGVSSGSNWDIVSTIIHGLGFAWETLSSPVKTAIGIIKGAFSFLSGLVGIAVGIGQGIYNALKPIICILLGCSPGIVPALQKVQEVFSSVWNFISGIVDGIVSGIVSSFSPMIDLLTQIGQFISGAFMNAWNYMVFVIQTVINTVRNVIGIFQLFLNGQISLPEAIFMVLQLLFNMYTTIYSKIIKLVIKFAAQMLSKAIQAGKNFVKGVINHLKQLPSKAYSALIAVVSKIVSAGAKWISTAKTQANKTKNGVYNSLKGTAKKVASALSGVANAIKKPFQEGYEQAKKSYDKIKNFVNNLPSLAGFGGAGGADDIGGYAGEITTSSSNVDHKVSGEFTITHDLKNLPNSVNEQLLAKLINESLNNDGFVKKLAENMTFQKYDLNIKNRIKARNNRARGI